MMMDFVNNPTDPLLCTSRHGTQEYQAQSNGQGQDSVRDSARVQPAQRRGIHFSCRNLRARARVRLLYTACDACLRGRVAVMTHTHTHSLSLSASGFAVLVTTLIVIQAILLESVGGVWIFHSLFVMLLPPFHPPSSIFICFSFFENTSRFIA